MSTLTEISQAIQTGKMKLIKELVPKAIEEGCSAQSILNEATALPATKLLFPRSWLLPAP